MDDAHGTEPGLKFTSISEALAAANFVEQILSSEHSWITNRLSWLFVSQAFCITAYVILITSSAMPGAEQQVTILRIGLPILGIACSIAVGIAVNAAGEVAKLLGNERARLSRYINGKAGTSIPLVGGDVHLRAETIRSTLWRGSLPQLLPWALCLLWIFLLIRVNFGL